MNVYGIKARKKRYLPAAVLLHNITGLLSISHYGPFIGRGVLVFEICVLYAGCRYFMKKALKKGCRNMQANFKGLVRLHVLPVTEPLLPMYEAIINAIQSIEESKNVEGKVQVSIES